MLENAPLEFSCPACGAKNTIKAGNVKTIGHVTCSGCGRRIEIKDDGVDKGLRDANRAIADFKKSLSSIGKGSKRR